METVVEMSVIERAARALAEAMGDDYDHAFASKADWIDARGDKGGRFRDVNEPRQSDYLEGARAVLQAIRTPTPEMVAEVVQQVGDPTPDQWALGEGANALLTQANMLGETACAEIARDWQAMIDAALAE